LSALALPPFSLRYAETDGWLPYASRTMSIVSSDEPSSTTTISIGPAYFWFSSEAIVWTITFSSLYAGTMMLTPGA
jgi:hypothetical protein